VLEDVVNVGQRPRSRTTRAISSSSSTRCAQRRQLPGGAGSLLLFDGLLISCRSARATCSSRSRSVCAAGAARRGDGLDLLAYAIIDTVVDHYFPVLEQISDQLEEIEESLLESPDHEDLEALYSLKRDLLRLRKATWPLREMVSGLAAATPPDGAGDAVYLARRPRPHGADHGGGRGVPRDGDQPHRPLRLQPVNRMNGIMKVLTVIATIFMPLTFLAGIWG